MADNNIFKKRSIAEDVKEIHDQIPNELHGILYRMALDIQDLKEIVLDQKSQKSKNERRDKMSKYNEQLPFGKIEDEDVADNPEDPLIYVETKVENAKLNWEGPGYSAPRHSDGSELFELTTRKNGELKQSIIGSGCAETIFNFISDGYWDYAE